MTKLLEQGIASVKNLPESAQETIGEMMIVAAEQHRSDMMLTPDQIEEVRKRVGDLNPNYATDAEMDAFLSKTSPG